MTTTAEIVTAEDLWRLPSDNMRYELVRGVLRQMSSTGNIHGRLAVRITSPLFQYVEANKLGTVYAAETGFKLFSDPDTVRAPDVAFVRRERIEEVGEVEGYWPGAPDLAVEVISPSDIYSEVEEKVFDWLDAGTRMVITINPRKNLVTVYRSLTEIVILTENDTLDGGDVVPGWRLAIKDIFA